MLGRVNNPLPQSSADARRGRGAANCCEHRKAAGPVTALANRGARPALQKPQGKLEKIWQKSYVMLAKLLYRPLFYSRLSLSLAVRHNPDTGEARAETTVEPMTKNEMNAVSPLRATIVSSQAFG